MKAVQVSKTGGPEVLELRDLPTPHPQPNEAVVQVIAIGVNFIDVYYREGRYPAKLPFVVGQEAAGIVTEVGGDVQSLKPGAHVAYAGVLGACLRGVCRGACRPAGHLARWFRLSKCRRTDAAGYDRALPHQEHLSA